MSQSTYQTLKEQYESAGIPFQEIRHQAGASAAEYHEAVGCRYSQQAKCLFVKFPRGSETAFAVYALPASKRGDLKAAGEALGARKVRLASADELQAHTGCRYGELPPSGRLFGVPLLLDRDLLNESEIYLNAGLIDVSFVVRPTDIAAMESPLLIETARGT